MPLPAEFLDLQKKASTRSGFHPETTIQLYEDLFKFVQKNSGKGCGIIEIGCYKGASSMALAYLCKPLNWPFFTIDISQEYIEYTRGLLTELGLADHSVLYTGTMQKFIKEMKFDVRPFMVFVDGDHTYKGVVADIKSILQLQPLPYAIAFHDFSLRTFNPDLPDIFVDKAILDTLGHHIHYLRIGEQITSKSPFIKGHPSPAGDYWEEGGTEGVIIPMRSINRVYAFLRRIYARLRSAFIK